MSLISRIEISNFLNSARTKQWNPDILLERIDLQTWSTMILAPNGTCKTSLSQALLACLTRSKTFADPTRQRMSPKGVMSHIRIEFVRPLGGPSDQHELIDGATVVKGENWVVGICGHFNHDDLIYYYYKGVLDDAPLGEKGDKTTLYPDADVEDAINAIPGSKYNVRSSEWKAFISNHIPPRQLRLLTQFQRSGAGDKEAPLFPVVKRKSDRYDQAFFYQHIVPQLMAGIHAPEKADGDEEEEQTFEHTLVNGSYRLIDAKKALEKTKRKLDQVMSIFGDLEALEGKASEVTKEQAAYKKQLAKVAEVAAILKQVESASLPGFPLMIPHSDPDVNALLAHMAIKPGGDVHIRATGIQQLLNLYTDVPTVVSKVEELPGGVRIQPIEIIRGKHAAKAPATGRYFSEIDAREFIQRVPDTYLKASASKRDHFLSTLETAFAHFRKRMDTSPIRLELANLKRQIAGIDEQVSRIKSQIGEADKERHELETRYNELDVFRRAWETMRDKSLFSEEELMAPKATFGAIQNELNTMEKELEDLNRALGGANELVKFRADYPGENPLDVEARLISDFAEIKSAIRRQEYALDDIRAAHGDYKCHNNSLSDHEKDLLAQQSKLAATCEAFEALQKDFPGRSVVEISRHLDEREESLERSERKSNDKVTEARLAHEHRKNVATYWEDGIRAEFLASQGTVETAKKKLFELLHDLQALEEFRAQFEPDADPKTIQRKRKDRAHGLESLKTGIENKIEAAQRRLNLLNDKQVAPGDIAEKALALIPDGQKFHKLFEVIEASDVPEAKKEKALTIFAPLIFSPVFPDSESASTLAASFEAKGLPVPVFLEDGLRKLLESDDLSGLEQAVQGHMSDMVDMILHPEKLEVAQDKAQRRLGTLQERLVTIQAGLAKYGPDSKETLLVELACDAVVRGSEDLAARLQGTITEELLRCQQLCDAMTAFVTDWHRIPEIPQGHLSHEAIVASFGVRAEEPLGISPENSPKMITQWAEKMDTRRDKFTVKLRIFEADLAEMFATVEANFREEEKRLTVLAGKAKTDLEDFRAKFRRQSKIARDLVNAVGYDPEALARCVEALKTLEEEVRSIDEAQNDLEELSDSLNISLRDKYGQKSTAHEKLERYNFKALAILIESGEMEDAGTIEKKISDVQQERQLLNKKTQFQFEDAEEYIPYLERDSADKDKIMTLSDSIGTLSGELGKHEDALKKLGDDILDITSRSKEYDDQLHRIQEEMKRFAQVLPDVEAVEESADASRVESIRTLLGALTRDESVPKDFVDAATHIADTIVEYKAQDKVRRAREKKDELDKARDAFTSSCDHFLKSQGEDTPAYIPRDVAAAKSDPILISLLLGRLKEMVEERSEKYASQKETHGKMWEDQVKRMVDMSAKATDAFRLLNRVCNKHDDGATFYFEAQPASEEVITALVEQVRDRVEVQYEKEEVDISHGVATKKHLKEKRMAGEFGNDVRKMFYQTFFSSPTIKFKHPLIAGGQNLVFDLDDNLSGGQRVALQLLMVVRLAEYAKEQDLRKSSGIRSRKTNIQSEQNFILLDGMLSSLSDDELIDESLRALEACRGVFQLIGLIHNKGYVNNYKIFRTFIAVRKWVPLNARNTNCRWVRFENVPEGAGNLAAWHSSVVLKGNEPAAKGVQQ